MLDIQSRSARFDSTLHRNSCVSSFFELAWKVIDVFSGRIMKSLDRGIAPSIFIGKSSFPRGQLEGTHKLDLDASWQG
jgi:hypothetical protein